jgi:beta-aspartyl-peptidase (threonine type)
MSTFAGSNSDILKLQPKLIVHGGAWNIPAAYEQDHLHGVQTAVSEVYPQLLAGASALDAVEAAVRILEEDPTFDAGRGAFLNEAGQVELDAMIMDGATLQVGAVAALQNVLHPVSVARRVMEKTEHCLLVAEGALRFAKSMGFEELAPEELLTARELKFFEEIKNQEGFKTHHPFLNAPSDTVGAVALDCFGNLAAATSTGGTARKMVGRVGDSPIPGAGAYADNALGAVSATGWGESIMRVLLSKTVCDLFENNEAMEAARMGIEHLAQKVQGFGGIIGISAKGHYAFSHNTPKMAFCFADPDGSTNSFIKCLQ